MAAGSALSREMVKAVQNNNQEEVAELCMAGEEVTGTYGMGDTIMHWAVTKISRYQGIESVQSP
jgi:hypothetical protein